MAPVAIAAAIFFFESHVIISAVSQYFLTFSATGDYYQRDQGERIDDAEALIRTEESFRQAIKNQPSNAKHWINLAYVKADLAEFDQEFYQAYKTAFVYGGKEYDINLLLVEIGFSYWNLIQVEYRPIIKQAVINLYDADGTAMLDFSDKYSKLKMVCIWINNEGRQNRRCDRALAKPKKRIIRRGS